MGRLPNLVLGSIATALIATGVAAQTGTIQLPRLTGGADMQHDARYSPDGNIILFCRAPNPKGPWQICVQWRDADESDFVALTKDGSNQSPDWHADE